MVHVVRSIYLGSVSFPEAVSHPRIHLGPIRGHLLVLQPRLNQVEGEDAGDANDAGDPPVDDLGQEGELLGGLLGHDGPLLPDGRHVQGLVVEVAIEDLRFAGRTDLMDLFGLSFWICGLRCCGFVQLLCRMYSNPGSNRSNRSCQGGCSTVTAAVSLKIERCIQAETFPPAACPLRRK